LLRHAQQAVCYSHNSAYAISAKEKRRRGNHRRTQRFRTTPLRNARPTARTGLLDRMPGVAAALADTIQTYVAIGNEANEASEKSVRPALLPLLRRCHGALTMDTRHRNPQRE
jgi:hypothetical protein